MLLLQCCCCKIVLHTFEERGVGAQNCDILLQLQQGYHCHSLTSVDPRPRDGLDQLTLSHPGFAETPSEVWNSSVVQKTSITVL